MVWAWGFFIFLILLLVALDLGVLHRRRHVPTTPEAIGWTLFWIILALLFNGIVYYAYEWHWFNLGLFAGSEENGRDAALKFLTGYIVEKSLSLDNIFVIALIFEYYKVPVQYQHRILIWGVLGALVLRGLMIGAGVVLITRFFWMNYLFGLFLLYTASKMLLAKEGTFDPEKNIFVRWLRKIIPITQELHDDHFFVRIKGVLTMTPLCLVLLQVEATDVLFAVDSIPAIFAITMDPFIVFTSNIFAILGLRALYFALASFMNRFRYLKVALVFILAFVGVKLLLSHDYPIPPYVSLVVILGMLFVGIMPTLLSKEPDDRPNGPLANDLKELFVMTYRQAKRFVIIVTGFTILVVGIAMLVLPGPAIVVIPLGLLILAREFVWAKRLLAKFKEKGAGVINIFSSKDKDGNKSP
ncbi:MAG: TerC/Alx family metal homeostasis membrane protein [Chlamydiales bacterium]|nr:TerC/Alx family metal homeostasis membrane protein [Chlamydiales bacterium]